MPSACSPSLRAYKLELVTRKVLALDATEAPEERVGMGARTGSGRGRGRPVVHGQREVEGIGWQFWYEAAGAI